MGQLLLAAQRDCGSHRRAGHGSLHLEMHESIPMEQGIA